jgi:hypothetical protein
MLMFDAGEPLAGALTEAIQSGNLDEFRRLLSERPELATATIVRRAPCGEQVRSLVHIATDYPRSLPNVTDTWRDANFAAGVIQVRAQLSRPSMTDRPSASRRRPPQRTATSRC